MKYETPELTALVPAINAVQATSSKALTNQYRDSSFSNETDQAYADWE